MSSYQYQALEHSDSIRILVLHPSPNESEPIACTIRHVRLQFTTRYPQLYPDLYTYEAVSYTWGDSTHTNSIYFNNGTARLSIGKNCYAALRRLRLVDEDRTVWIDAVCIYQADLQERGSQVCMMKEIYDRALRVMVMLSDEIPDSRLLLDELAEVNEIIESGAELMRPRPSANIVRQLEVLFQDSWFKRTWVLQEACANPYVTIVYGSAIVPFKALVRLYFGYDSNTMVTLSQWPRPLELIHRDQREYTTPEFSLWRQLYEARHCQATDPRDKVFALRSLVGPRQSELDHLIDYTRSVEDTFQRVATYLLPVIGLRIFSATRHPHKLDMASWIPDWSQTLPLHYNAFYDEHDYEVLNHEGAMSIPASYQQERIRLSYSYLQHGHRLELHVSGYRHSHVVECSPMFHFIGMHDAEYQMKAIYNSLPNTRQDLVLESTWNVTTMPVYFRQKINFSQKIIHGKPIHDITLSIDEIAALSLMDGVDLHFGLTRRSHGGVSPIRSNQDQVLTHHQRDSIPFHIEVSDLHDALQHCRIALMEDGHLAIVPGDAKSGDVVCIISGAMAPCLLRPDRDGCWVLVSGDCHLFELGMTDVSLLMKLVSQNVTQREEFRVR